MNWFQLVFKELLIQVHDSHRIYLKGLVEV
jgi:hypothetical protein